VGHESAGLALLGDGRVLVAGGHALTRGRKWTLIDAAELYDPQTETWHPTGGLVEKRQGVWSLVVLNNGKVLLAGEHDPLTSAELYDPQTGKWSATGKLITGRGGHTTTLLTDGSVLIAGGIDYSADGTPIFASAEVFDPATETWSATGSMAVARFKHAAVRLASGEVLVVGGTSSEPSDNRPLASAEIYNPTTGSWRAVGSLAAGRELVKAVLLPDGRVLAVGGCVGDFGRYKALASAEIYDPQTEMWTATGALAEARTQFAMTLLADGRVLAAGGARPFTSALSTAELYDPASGKWSSAGSMRTKRWNHRAVLLPSGEVLVVGGCDLLGELKSVEVYSPSLRASP
jgi:N-acetylneuraminic acid mutarotase